jgi:citron Rho-interacting kinase
MAKFYIVEILLGLRELHSLGYIHRDIKPENVMISADGHLRLVDFGSSVKLDSSGKVSRA